MNKSRRAFAAFSRRPPTGAEAFGGSCDPVRCDTASSADSFRRCSAHSWVQHRKTTKQTATQAPPPCPPLAAKSQPLHPHLHLLTFSSDTSPSLLRTFAESCLSPLPVSTGAPTLKISETELTPLMPRVALIPPPLLSLVTSSNLPRLPLVWMSPSLAPSHVIWLNWKAGGTFPRSCVRKNNKTLVRCYSLLFFHARFLFHRLFILPVTGERTAYVQLFGRNLYHFSSPLHSGCSLESTTTCTTGRTRLRVLQLDGLNFNLCDVACQVMTTTGWSRLDTVSRQTRLASICPPVATGPHLRSQHGGNSSQQFQCLSTVTQNTP